MLCVVSLLGQLPQLCLGQAGLGAFHEQSQVPAAELALLMPCTAKDPQVPVPTGLEWVKELQSKPRPVSLLFSALGKTLSNHP